MASTAGTATASIRGTATASIRGTAREALSLAVLPLVLLAAAAGTWPLWHRYPVLAGVTTLVVTVLVMTGVVLLTDPQQRPVGAGLVLAGVLLELSWCNEWGSGPLPVLSLVEGHGWLFLVGWALYRYPGPRLARRERRCFQLITGWVLVWPWALILTSRPNWREYPADAWWPALWADRTAHTVATWAVGVTAVAALGLYVGLWISRLRASHGARRAAQLPNAIAVFIGAGCAALVPLADVNRLPLHYIDLLDTVATVGVLAIPGALLVAVARRQLARAGLTSLLVELQGAATAEAAVHVLRRALDDETLVVGLWSPAGGAFLDDDGRPVTAPQSPDSPDGPDRPDDLEAIRRSARRSPAGGPGRRDDR